MGQAPDVAPESDPTDPNSAPVEAPTGPADSAPGEGETRLYLQTPSYYVGYNYVVDESTTIEVTRSGSNVPSDKANEIIEAAAKIGIVLTDKEN